MAKFLLLPSLSIQSPESDIGNHLLFVQFFIHNLVFSDHTKAARPLLKRSALKEQRSFSAAVKLPGTKRSIIFMFLLLLVPGALCLAPFISTADAASVTLAWDYNQEDDLAGYRLHYGNSSGNYSEVIDVGNNNRYTVGGLSAGVAYYFAVTAYDSQGSESGYSTELAYTPGVITHTITALAGDNGRITPGGLVTVNQGTNKTFSMNSDPNFQILNVKVDGISLGTVSRYTFDNISTDHIIEVSFAFSGPEPEADSDMDGVPDDQDDFPGDPDEATDTDGDGEGDNAVMKLW